MMGLLVHTYNPSTGEGEVGGGAHWSASLIYLVSPRPGRDPDIKGVVSKYLPCKHKDLDSIPRTHIIMMMMIKINPGYSGC